MQRRLRVAASAVALVLVAGCGGSDSGNGATPAPGAASAASVAAPASCASSGPVRYICGLTNAEDILPLGSTGWLLTSGMSTQSAPGKIYLVNRASKTAEEFFPDGAVALHTDTAVFGSCPGPINTTNFSAHGLALREQTPGVFRLYMTSHGEREAIEVFDVDATGAKPTIVWVGCVLLPDKTSSNSVAILNDGGFVTTKMWDPTDPDARAQVRAGEVTGNVFEWHPGGAVTFVEGTELSAANGIELSPDQRWMYVAAIGAHSVVRFDRQASPIAKTVIPVSVNPDNVRWGENGKLYTAGNNYVPPSECATPPCRTGWSVVEIDTDTLETKRVTGVDQNDPLQGAATGIPVGNEIWIGTFQGDRIGYMAKP